MDFSLWKLKYYFEIILNKVTLKLSKIFQKLFHNAMRKAFEKLQKLILILSIQMVIYQFT